MPGLDKPLHNVMITAFSEQHNLCRLLLKTDVNLTVLWSLQLHSWADTISMEFEQYWLQFATTFYLQYYIPKTISKFYWNSGTSSKV